MTTALDTPPGGSVPPGGERRATGVAAVLALLNAARDAVDDYGQGVPPATCMSRIAHAAAEFDVLLGQHLVWVRRTWADVVELGPGTRVRLRGVDAVVETAVLQTWNVDPCSTSYNPRPLAHTVASIRLRVHGRTRRYDLPPEGEVEVPCLPSSPPVGSGESLADWVGEAAYRLDREAVRVLGEVLGAVEIKDERSTTDGE